MISRILAILLVSGFVFTVAVGDVHAIRRIEVKDKIEKRIQKLKVKRLKRILRSGRVKVKFPWIRINDQGQIEVNACALNLVKKDENSSCWVRVSQL